ncbi:MAG TPA: hypothetical protein VF947_08105 [Myxococcales bacterium]
MAAQVAELEHRMKLLEARLRNAVADGVLANASSAVSVGRNRGAKRARARARCPGCLLELPPGRHGTNCVWCGFSFEAVPARP